ncbi:unnamed protein product [Larinioides sclopetarius]|uniref:Uncharacterized protein n=1 Tax=Larinioides sclopetarius TaxID=280406 RepID=A0AAV2BEB1_9ARAC
MSGKFLPFLCLILVCVLHLANGQCEQWTEDELISCIMQGTCYDCSIGCDCNSGYVRSIEGVCIPTNLCSSIDGDEVTVAEDRGCPKQSLCRRSCIRSGKKGGRCTGPKKRKCRCN